jgi:hypothetical protein
MASADQLDCWPAIKRPRLADLILLVCVMIKNPLTLPFSFLSARRTSNFAPKKCCHLAGTEGAAEDEGAEARCRFGRSEVQEEGSRAPDVHQKPLIVHCATNGGNRCVTNTNQLRLVFVQ